MAQQRLIAILAVTALFGLSACGWWPSGSPSSAPMAMPDKEEVTETETETEDPDEQSEPKLGAQPDSQVTPDDDMSNDDDPPIDEEETEDQPVTPPPPDSVTSLSPWIQDRTDFRDDRGMIPMTVSMDGMDYSKTGMVPNGNAYYIGDIDGTIREDRAGVLTEPKIRLDVNLGDYDRINAQISFFNTNSMQRSTLARYGAFLRADGTWDSFDMSENPAGFDGAFYGDHVNGSAPIAYGRVSSPNVYGTYTATSQ